MAADQEKRASHHPQGLCFRCCQPVKETKMPQPTRNTGDAVIIPASGRPEEEWGKPTQAIPVEAQLWSDWFPGDGGRWFYQARLTSDGSGWEYRFAEGYSFLGLCQEPVRRSMHSVSVGDTSRDTAPSIVPATSTPTPSSSSSATTSVSSLDKPSSVNIIAHEPVSTGRGEEDGGIRGRRTANLGSRQARQAPDARPQPALPRPTERAAIEWYPAQDADALGSEKAVDQQQPERYYRGSRQRKKFNAVVSSEKQMRFNPTKKVKVWLDGVDV